MKKQKKEIVGYTIDGKIIDKDILDTDLEQAEMEIKNGDYLTHSQLKKEIKRWRAANN